MTGAGDRSDDDPLALVDGAVVVRVHVQPRASHTGIAGRHGGAVKVAVGAAPVDGRANDAVAGVLATTFGRRPREVALVSGAQSREKRFRVDGIDLVAARRMLAEAGALSLDAPHR